MEYFLHYWGGAEETIKKELNINDNYFWFKTKDERDRFLSKIKRYSHLGLALDVKESDNFTHKQTIAKVKLKYNNKEYEYNQDFSYEYPANLVHFMYEEGNYSCDCNRSLFIQRHCDSSFKEIGCGEKIQLMSLDVMYK
jgi:hypothetical protein